MKVKMETTIYVDTGSTDPEEAATDMNNGLANALSHFPSGDVVHAEVDVCVPAEGDDLGHFE